MASASDGILREAATKVPEVTVVFWIIKIAATTLGKTGGDSVTMTLNWGYLTRHPDFSASLGFACRGANRGQAFPSIPLLGHNRRIDHVRHDNGRLR
jgi:hypothetical protein